MSCADCISAIIAGQGIDELLERYGASRPKSMELKANHFPAQASGAVSGSQPLRRSRRSTATVLVHRGSLSAGDVSLPGPGFGTACVARPIGSRPRGRAPGWTKLTAVEITGLSEMPGAGDEFHCVENLRMAADAALESYAPQKPCARKHLAARDSTGHLGQLVQRHRRQQKERTQGHRQSRCRWFAASAERSAGQSWYRRGPRLDRFLVALAPLAPVTVTLAEAIEGRGHRFIVIAEGKARRQADDKGIEINTYHRDLAIR